MAAAAGWNEDVAREIVTQLSGLEGATLPILHALQNEFGYIDPAAVPLIADALNISRAEVHGTISFYHDFRHAPAGRRVIKICRAEACQANGCEDILDEVCSRAGLSPDLPGNDRLTIETVYCLDADRLIGLCANGSVEDAQTAAGETK
jgi:formate dehydrogenase subunit gamma